VQFLPELPFDLRLLLALPVAASLLRARSLEHLLSLHGLLLLPRPGLELLALERGIPFLKGKPSCFAGRLPLPHAFHELTLNLHRPHTPGAPSACTRFIFTRARATGSLGRRLCGSRCHRHAVSVFIAASSDRARDLSAANVAGILFRRLNQPGLV
jgi:hypothetical protein